LPKNSILRFYRKGYEYETRENNLEIIIKDNNANGIYDKDDELYFNLKGDIDIDFKLKGAEIIRYKINLKKSGGRISFNREDYVFSQIKTLGKAVELKKALIGSWGYIKITEIDKRIPKKYNLTYNNGLMNIEIDKEPQIILPNSNMYDSIIKLEVKELEKDINSAVNSVGWILSAYFN